MRFGGFQGHQEDTEQMLPPESRPPLLHLLSTGRIAKISGKGGAVWRKPEGWICCEDEEGCNLQPLFSSPISTAQLSTCPGLNCRAGTVLVH